MEPAFALQLTFCTKFCLSMDIDTSPVNPAPPFLPTNSTHLPFIPQNTCIPLQQPPSRRISIIAHSGHSLLDMVASLLSNYYEAEEKLREEQRGVRSPRAVNIGQHAVRRASTARTPRSFENPSVRVLDRRQRYYDSLDLELL